MKVILSQDVKGLGKKDSMVNVSDGYARNYLFPKKLAMEASDGNVNIMKQRNDAEKNRKQRELDHAGEMADKLKEIKIQIKAKVGENGKLFGSITSKEIAEKLADDFQIEMDKKKFLLEEPIKSIGTFEVEIKLYPEVTGKLTVIVEQL